MLEFRSFLIHFSLYLLLILLHFGLKSGSLFFYASVPLRYIRGVWDAIFSNTDHVFCLFLPYF